MITIDTLRKFCDGTGLDPFEIDELKAAGYIDQNLWDRSWFVTTTGHVALERAGRIALHVEDGAVSGRLQFCGENSSQCPDEDSYLPPPVRNPNIKWTPLPDMVNHPPHYKQGDIECIDAIRAALTEEEYRGYCKGNALKYIWREKHKGGDESLAKAGWYLDRMVK